MLHVLGYDSCKKHATFLVRVPLAIDVSQHIQRDVEQIRRKVGGKGQHPFKAVALLRHTLLARIGVAKDADAGSSRLQFAQLFGSSCSVSGNRFSALVCQAL